MEIVEHDEAAISIGREEAIEDVHHLVGEAPRSRLTRLKPTRGRAEFLLVFCAPIEEEVGGERFRNATYGPDRKGLPLEPTPNLAAD